MATRRTKSLLGGAEHCMTKTLDCSDPGPWDLRGCVTCRLFKRVRSALRCAGCRVRDRNGHTALPAVVLDFEWHAFYQWKIRCLCVYAGQPAAARLTSEGWQGCRAAPRTSRNGCGGSARHSRVREASHLGWPRVEAGRSYGRRISTAYRAQEPILRPEGPQNLQQSTQGGLAFATLRMFANMGVSNLCDRRLSHEAAPTSAIPLPTAAIPDMAIRPPCLPDRNKHRAEVWVPLMIDRSGRECRTATPGSERVRFCGDLHKCLACRAREHGGAFARVLQEQYVIDEAIQDQLSDSWRYPPRGQQRGKDSIRFLTCKTISVFWQEPEARAELIKVGGMAITAEDLKLKKQLGALQEITVRVAELCDRCKGVRKARGYYMPEPALEEDWHKAHPESSWDMKGIAENLRVVFGLCWMWEDPHVAPGIKDHLSEVADWGEVRADLEYDIEYIWWQLTLAEREAASAEQTSRRRMMALKEHKLAHPDANLQSLYEEKVELIREVDRLGAAVKYQEQRVIAKDAVIESLRNKLGNKDEEIASLSQALEPYEEKDMALREDVLLLERTRLRAETLYLQVERDAGLSPDVRAQGAQELLVALKDIQDILSETGRRVGVTIADAHELFRSEVPIGDATLPEARREETTPEPAQP